MADYVFKGSSSSFVPGKKYTFPSTATVVLTDGTVIEGVQLKDSSGANVSAKTQQLTSGANITENYRVNLKKDLFPYAIFITPKYSGNFNPDYGVPAKMVCTITVDGKKITAFNSASTALSVNVGTNIVDEIKAVLGNVDLTGKTLTFSDINFVSNKGYSQATEGTITVSPTSFTIIGDTNNFTITAKGDYIAPSYYANIKLELVVDSSFDTLYTNQIFKDFIVEIDLYDSENKHYNLCYDLATKQFDSKNCTIKKINDGNLIDAITDNISFDNTNGGAMYFLTLTKKASSEHMAEKTTIFYFDDDNHDILTSKEIDLSIFNNNSATSTIVSKNLPSGTLDKTIYLNLNSYIRSAFSTSCNLTIITKASSTFKQQLQEISILPGYVGTSKIKIYYQFNGAPDSMLGLATAYVIYDGSSDVQTYMLADIYTEALDGEDERRNYGSLGISKIEYLNSSNTVIKEAGSNEFNCIFSTEAVNVSYSKGSQTITVSNVTSTLSTVTGYSDMYLHCDGFEGTDNMPYGYQIPHTILNVNGVQSGNNTWVIQKYKWTLNINGKNINKEVDLITDRWEFYLIANEVANNVFTSIPTTDIEKQITIIVTSQKLKFSFDSSSEIKMEAVSDNTNQTINVTLLYNASTKTYYFKEQLNIELNPIKIVNDFNWTSSKYFNTITAKYKLSSSAVIPSGFTMNGEVDSSACISIPDNIPVIKDTMSGRMEFTYNGSDWESPIITANDTINILDNDVLSVPSSPRICETLSFNVDFWENKIEYIIKNNFACGDIQFQKTTATGGVIFPVKLIWDGSKWLFVEDPNIIIPLNTVDTREGYNELLVMLAISGSGYLDDYKCVNIEQVCTTKIDGTTGYLAFYIDSGNELHHDFTINEYLNTFGVTQDNYGEYDSFAYVSGIKATLTADNTGTKVYVGTYDVSPGIIFYNFTQKKWYFRVNELQINDAITLIDNRPKIQYRKIQVKVFESVRDFEIRFHANGTLSDYIYESGTYNIPVNADGSYYCDEFICDVTQDTLIGYNVYLNDTIWGVIDSNRDSKRTNTNSVKFTTDSVYIGIDKPTSGGETVALRIDNRTPENMFTGFIIFSDEPGGGRIIEMPVDAYGTYYYEIPCDEYGMSYIDVSNVRSHNNGKDFLTEFCPNDMGCQFYNDLFIPFNAKEINSFTISFQN